LPTAFVASAEPSSPTSIAQIDGGAGIEARRLVQAFDRQRALELMRGAGRRQERRRKR
jgi:hypothetical protein